MTGVTWAWKLLLVAGIVAVMFLISCGCELAGGPGSGCAA